jgi:hypothetical protein
LNHSTFGIGEREEFSVKSILKNRVRIGYRTAENDGNRSRPVEDFRGWLLVEAGFDGGAEPLEHGAFLQAAGF